MDICVYIYIGYVHTNSTYQQTSIAQYPKLLVCVLPSTPGCRPLPLPPRAPVLLDGGECST